MSMLSGMKLGLTINNKLKGASNREAVIKSIAESIESQGHFTVVEWSVLGKKLGVYGTDHGG